MNGSKIISQNMTLGIVNRIVGKPGDDFILNSLRAAPTGQQWDKQTFLDKIEKT